MKHIKWTATNTVLRFATETDTRLMKDVLTTRNWSKVTYEILGYLQIISLQSQLLIHKIRLLSSKHPTVNMLHNSHGPGSGLGLMLQAETQMQGLRDIQNRSLEVIHLCSPRTLHNSPSSTWRHRHAQTHHATSKVGQKPIPILYWKLASKIGS